MKELIMAKCVIQVKGNLARDVEAKVSKAGKMYSVLSVGSTPSKKLPSGEWENGETMWFNVTVFAELNPFEFKKGSPVEVEGTFVARHYTKKDGTQGLSLDVTADGEKVKVVPRKESVSPNASQAKENWNAPSNWNEVTPLVNLEDAPF
jgi:single-stranded DNA-binding protein